MSFCFLQNQLKHQKTASVDSQQSSSSDQPITSDLTNSHYPSIVNSTNHIPSPSLSPLSSPRLARTLSGGADSLPVSLEKVIKIKKSRDPLGLHQLYLTWKYKCTVYHNTFLTRDNSHYFNWGKGDCGNFIIYFYLCIKKRMMDFNYTCICCEIGWKNIIECKWFSLYQDVICDK